MEPQPGELVTPTIRLRHSLTSGGMGTLWVADHLALHTQVAVKFLSAELALLPDQRARFSKEAAAASQVKSPHVVQMLDHGVTSEGRPFLVMELLEGEDVAQRLKREGPLPVKVVGELLRQIGKALQKAHEAGIIHRDLKPENIFICATGDDEMFCKLLDFGIAKGEHDPSAATQTGTVIGTVHYMSPEQLIASPTLDPRSDLWALGVVTYLLLTGRRPWAGNTIGSLTLAVHNEKPPKMSELWPSLPSALDDWFEKACALDRFDRFRSAREMTNAFAVAAGLSALVVEEQSSGHEAQTRPEKLDGSTDSSDLRDAPTAKVDPTLPAASAAIDSQTERVATPPVMTSESSVVKQVPAGEKAPSSKLALFVGVGVTSGILLALVLSNPGRTEDPPWPAAGDEASSAPPSTARFTGAARVSTSSSSSPSASLSTASTATRSPPATPRPSTGKTPGKSPSADVSPPRVVPPSENEPPLQ